MEMWWGLWELLRGTYGKSGGGEGEEEEEERQDHRC